MIIQNFPSWPAQPAKRQVIVGVEDEMEPSLRGEYFYSSPQTVNNPPKKVAKPGFLQLASGLAEGSRGIVMQLMIVLLLMIDRFLKKVRSTFRGYVDRGAVQRANGFRTWPQTVVTAATIKRPCWIPRRRVFLEGMI